MGLKASRTCPGCVVGTPEYMSPEQGAGKAVDYRSDIYSFGVILYNLVTGETLFSGDSYGEILLKHMTTCPPRPSTVPTVPHVVPAELEELILACLEKDPLNRPESMAVVRDRLLQIAQRRSRQPEWPDAPVRSRRPFWIAGAFAAGAVALIVGLAAIYVSRDTEAGAAPAAESVAVPRSTVTISFDSNPPGAEVWREGGGEPLGITPLEATVDRIDGVASFELRKAGFEGTRAEIPLNEDGRVVISLRAVAGAPAAQDVGAEPDARIDGGEGARPPARARWTPAKQRPRAATPGAPQAPATPRSHDRNGLVDPYGD
jgi:hypothetical protein